MTHRDASRTQSTRQTDRPAPAGPRPAPGGATRGGFTKSELDLIHATAEANGLSICVCTVVVPDGTFPPTPDGAPRPEVARILSGLRKDAQAANRLAGFGTLADAAPPSRAASAVAYDRDAHDLEASRRLAVAGDQADVSTFADVALADGLEAERG